MKDLLVSRNERLENYFNALNVERNERAEWRKDFDFKLNALIDAQIRNQDEIDEFKKASKLILKRVERLEN